MRGLWRRGRERGQGMTEYIIVVGLVGILLAATVWTFKEQIRVTIVGGSATAQEWTTQMDEDDDLPDDLPEDDGFGEEDDEFDPEN